MKKKRLLVGHVFSLIWLVLLPDESYLVRILQIVTIDTIDF